MALIYQAWIKTGADLSAELVVRQDPFISDQSQRTDDWVLINVVAEFDRH